MAHVGVVSAAYWGDVMPFVPIADELAARGHRVTFAVPEGFHDVLGGHDFELLHLGTDFSPRELADHGDVMEHADTIRGMQAAIDLWVRQLCLDPIDDILAVLDGLAPDLWLTHNTPAWLVELQAAPTGTPVVAGHLFPMMVPSAHQAPPMLPLPGRGWPPVNRLGWRVGRRMIARMMFDDRINELRAGRGLAPADANVGFSWERADRVLLLCSEHYWPRLPDWPDHLVHTGFTVWGDDAPLPDDVRAFLHDGEPPVVVTLGTSAATNARDAFRLAAGAVEAAGHRPMLLVGTQANLDALGDRDDAWVFAPLPAVLPRCRAVVHAAGHGTTAAALTAGTPQVVMPQGFDQRVHAVRVQELGVGVEVRWKRRSHDRLVGALGAVADSRRRRAGEVAALLADEDGPARAADEVEAVLAA